MINGKITLNLKKDSQSSEKLCTQYVSKAQKPKLLIHIPPTFPLTPSSSHSAPQVREDGEASAKCKGVPTNSVINIGTILMQ